jgi:hypothetical protein
VDLRQAPVRIVGFYRVRRVMENSHQSIDPVDSDWPGGRSEGPASHARYFAAHASSPSGTSASDNLSSPHGCRCPNCGHYSLSLPTEETNHTGIKPNECEQLPSRLLGFETDNRLDLLAKGMIAIEQTLKSLDQNISDLQQRLVAGETRQEWYSIRAAAQFLGKAEFTVREWCRHERVNAQKRESGRGGKREWMISHDELDRIRNKGLLPANL